MLKRKQEKVTVNEQGAGTRCLGRISSQMKAQAKGHKRKSNVKRPPLQTGIWERRIIVHGISCADSNRDRLARARSTP